MNWSSIMTQHLHLTPWFTPQDEETIERVVSECDGNEERSMQFLLDRTYLAACTRTRLPPQPQSIRKDNHPIMGATTRGIADNNCGGPPPPLFLLLFHQDDFINILLVQILHLLLQQQRSWELKHHTKPRRWDRVCWRCLKKWNCVPGPAKLHDRKERLVAYECSLCIHVLLQVGNISIVVHVAIWMATILQCVWWVILK